MTKIVLFLFSIVLYFSAQAAEPINAPNSIRRVGNVWAVYNAEVYRSNRPNYRIISIGVSKVVREPLCEEGSDWVVFHLQDIEIESIDVKDANKDLVIICSNSNTVEGCYTKQNFRKKYPKGYENKCYSE